MMKKILLPLGALALAGTAQAALVAYEGFGGYTVDTPIETQTGGGSGWSNDWYPANANTTDDDYWYAGSSNLSNGAYSGTGLSSSAGSTYYSVGAQVINGHNVVTRNMTTAFDGNTGGTVYISYLVNGTAWDTNVARLSLSMDQTGRFLEIDNGGTNGRNLQIEMRGSPGAAGGVPPVVATSASEVFNASGGTYFIVAKINLTSGVDSPLGSGPFPYNTFNGEDTIQVKVYGDLDTVGLEPTTWDVEGIQYWDSVNQFNAIELISSNVDQYAFDEIRVGTSWADVTAVPEPSTYALLFGFLALGFTMWRRKRNQ
ncbi:MAG: PEP-CTERM sorting domain-containing protein [Oceanipulchritudo sp.]